jgi:serine/threonine protein kinase
MSGVIEVPVMRIGRYAIIEVIGQGAMGTVYKALDPLIERTVAIKTVPIARLKEESTEFEARFLREAKSAGRLSHPNIVTIYDVGETDEIAYIAMEYLSGITLREIMDHGPLPLDLALTTALQIAEALAYAHDHGVIHRDIKPSNVVIVSERTQVKLTDFGIAQLANSERTHIGLMLGSPRYMSPEQAMGREINGSSDIFSLGALLYEMLSGNYAFVGDNLPGILYRVINESPSSLVKARPEISPTLERVVMRALSKRPDGRPSARTLIADLQQVAQAEPGILKLKNDNRVPRLLPGVAFLTPLAVFLIIGVGIAVIQKLVPVPVEQTVIASTALPLPGAIKTPTLTLTPSSSMHTASTPDKTTNTSQTTRLKTKRIKPVQPSDKNPPEPGQSLINDPYLKSLQVKEEELEIRKTELMLKYTEAHPDVVLIDNQLKRLREERRRRLIFQHRS